MKDLQIRLQIILSPLQFVLSPFWLCAQESLLGAVDCMGGWHRKKRGRKEDTKLVSREDDRDWRPRVEPALGRGGLSPLLSPAFVGRFHQI